MKAPPRRLARQEAQTAVSPDRAQPSLRPAKLGTEKLTPDEQRRRFIEAAREAGASEDEAEFDRTLGAIVRSAPKPAV